ncbi:MAG TPA: hypothetical protein VGE31_00135 [Candidatus Paceibacterota bacterium]
MKKFLTVSIILFLFAALIAFALFWYVSSSSYAGRNLKTLGEKVSTELSGDAPVATNTAQQTPDDTLTESIPDEGVPLASLALTTEQKNALTNLGINVETFVLTKPMLICGAVKLGDARIEEIKAGAAPSYMEMTKLLPCLTAR